MTIDEYCALAKYVAKEHSPLAPNAKKPVIKYMTSNLDFRTNTVFFVALVGMGGKAVEFYNTNEQRSNPKSLLDRIMDYLNAKDSNH